MRAWRAACVLCIVCLFLFLAAVGCGRPRPGDHLRVEFLSDLTGEENLRLFVLHNQGDEPVSFRAIRLKDRQTGESLSADLLKMTHENIGPDAWEYGIVKQIKDWDADKRGSEDLYATVEYTVGKKAYYSTCPTTCSQNNRWETRFYPSADLSSFILYLEREADSPVSADTVQEISINGRILKGFRRFPVKTGDVSSALNWNLRRRLSPGNASFAGFRLKIGRISAEAVQKSSRLLFPVSRNTEKLSDRSLSNSIGMT